MRDISVQVQFYGVFRKHGEFVELSCPNGSSLSSVKRELIKNLGESERDIINDSVLSDDSRILPDEFIVQHPISLSILPPVCGG